MEKLNLLESSNFRAAKDFLATQSKMDFAASTIICADENLDTEVDTRMLKKSKNTLSRKSLKSVGVNEDGDGKRK